MGTSQTGHRRSFERRTTALAALFYPEKGGCQRGIVCDVSAHGLFLRPVGALPPEIGVGSSVRIVFVVRLGSTEKKVDAQGIVRWLGQSAQHKSPGLGIEVKRPYGVLFSIAMAPVHQLSEFVAAPRSDKRLAA